MQLLPDRSALGPQGDLRAKIDAHRATLAAAQRLNQGADLIEADIAVADEAVSTAKAASADAIVRSATGAAGAPADPQRRKLAAAATDAVLHREACGDAHAQVLADLAPVEAEIDRTTRFRLDGLPERFASEHAARMSLILEARVRESLLPLVLEVAAFADATGSADAQRWLSELCIPSLVGGGVVPLLNGTEFRAGAECVKVREAWRAVPELAEAHRILSEPRDVLREVQAYTPRASRKAQAVPYVRKGYTHEGVTGEKRADADAGSDRSRIVPPGRVQARAHGRVVEERRGEPGDVDVGRAMLRNMLADDLPPSEFAP